MCHKGFIMILYVRSEDGSIQQVEVTKDLVINPASGQQFYFDDNHGDFKLSLANDDQDVNLAIDVNGTIVNVYFSDMVPLLNNNDSALAIAKNENGTQEIQDNLQNQTFSGQEILDALNAAFEENNIALVQDFGSLTNELDAAAAGGENNSDSVNFITDAKIDTFDENSLVQRDRLEVENEEVGFIDSNGVPTDDGEPETGTSTPTKISVTVTLEDVIVEEGAGTATIGATLSSAPTEGSLVITLDNGATITFGTDYTPGDIVQSTPFVIQSDDVYNDAETYTVEMSGYTGGNEFESVDVTDTAKVTVSDTTDTTTMTLETSAINESYGPSSTGSVSLRSSPAAPVISIPRLGTVSAATALSVWANSNTRKTRSTSSKPCLEHANENAAYGTGAEIPGRTRTPPCARIWHDPPRVPLLRFGRLGVHLAAGEEGVSGEPGQYLGREADVDAEVPHQGRHGIQPLLRGGPDRQSLLCLSQPHQLTDHAGLGHGTCLWSLRVLGTERSAGLQPGPHGIRDVAGQEGEPEPFPDGREEFLQVLERGRIGSAHAGAQLAVQPGPRG